MSPVIKNVVILLFCVMMYLTLGDAHAGILGHSKHDWLQFMSEAQSFYFVNMDPMFICDMYLRTCILT